MCDGLLSEDRKKKLPRIFGVPALIPNLGSNVGGVLRVFLRGEQLSLLLGRDHGSKRL